jgi:hypothetical protein
MDYPPLLSWELGKAVAGETPFPGLTAVSFYPGPNDARVPTFWSNFLAYLRGANGLPFSDPPKNIPDEKSSKIISDIKIERPQK